MFLLLLLLALGCTRYETGDAAFTRATALAVANPGRKVAVDAKRDSDGARCFVEVHWFGQAVPHRADVANGHAIAGAALIALAGGFGGGAGAAAASFALTGALGLGITGLLSLIAGIALIGNANAHAGEVKTTDPDTIFVGADGAILYHF